MIVAVDWDDTLVDDHGTWLPGALDGLRWLRRQHHRVVIHSSRANHPDGLQTIQAKLDQHKLGFKIVPKYGADVYVDDKAVRFTGSWPQTIRGVRDATA